MTIPTPAPARARPLSPHVSIYRLGPTMVLSFMHRVAGVWMSVGLCALVYWLMSAAGGAVAYDSAVSLFTGWLFRLLLLSWLAAFCYHFANGLRHLVWDAGFFMEKQQARVSARWVVAVALIGLLVCGAFFLGLLPWRGSMR